MIRRGILKLQSCCLWGWGRAEPRNADVLGSLKEARVASSPLLQQEPALPPSALNVAISLISDA